MTLPQFPNFKRLEYGDKAAIERITRTFPPYSDFNFTSLWVWDVDSRRMVCELNGNLVVKFTDYSTSKQFLSFLGTNMVTETAEALLNYASDNGLPLSLELMPSSTVRHIGSSTIAVEEDRDNFDYVYLVPYLEKLQGPRFQMIRYMSRKFQRRNPLATSCLLDMNDRSAQNQMLSVVSVWESNKIDQDKQYEMDHELAAMRRLFSGHLNGNFLSVGIVHPSELIGFIVLELLPDNHSVCHFWKGDVRFSGIYEFLKQESAKYLLARGAEMLNFEQDLGIPNLRRAKLAFRPHSFLKKYRVSWRAGVRPPSSL